MIIMNEQEYFIFLVIFANTSCFDCLSDLFSETGNFWYSSNTNNNSYSCDKEIFKKKKKKDIEWIIAFNPGTFS